MNQNAFANCPKLADLEVKERVTSIGDYAFLNCSSLNNVTFRPLFRLEIYF
ncbi:MAG: leucine-rich repeat protein [Bacteroidales bacterium]|nr:leucine-rich repeat protein [Bacteroidales bacterium]